MGYAEWHDLAAMASSEAPRRRHLPGNVSAKVTGEGLELRLEPPATNENRPTMNSQVGS
jgi:hypothetical protein